MCVSREAAAGQMSQRLQPTHEIRIELLSTWSRDRMVHSSLSWELLLPSVPSVVFTPF